MTEPTTEEKLHQALAERERVRTERPHMAAVAAALGEKAALERAERAEREVEEQAAAFYAGLHDKERDRLKDRAERAENRLEQVLKNMAEGNAQLAAMREALGNTAAILRTYDVSPEHGIWKQVDAALSPDAGSKHPRGTDPEAMDRNDRLVIHAGYVPVERLKPVREALSEAQATLNQTHTNHCSVAWTDRNLHAPECLMYEVDGLDAALALLDDLGVPRG